MRASLAAVVVAGLALAGCRAPVDQRVSRGAAAISKYGCGSCHTLSGVRGANGKVGPPLTGIGSRLYVAGMLQNTPENLASWIHHPKKINPRTAMPDVGASERDASDMAAYLSSR